MKDLASIPVSEAATVVLPVKAEGPVRRVIALWGNGAGAPRGQTQEASADSGALRQYEESGGAGERRIRLTHRIQCTAYATVGERQLRLACENPLQGAGRLTLRSCDEAAENCQIPVAGCGTPSPLNETMQADKAWICGTTT